MKRQKTIIFIRKKHFQRFFSSLINHPTQVFVIIALFFGLLFIFRLPPLTGTDEFSHFPRVYQITKGIYWEQKLPDNQYGGYLPNNINKMINNYRDLSRKPNSQEFNKRAGELFKTYSSTTQLSNKNTEAIFTSVVIYPPWAYVPSVMGVLAAKLLSLPLIWYVYLGRFLTLVTYVSFTAWAINLLPRGKWFLVVLGLLPVSLTQASIIGADGLVNGLSWLIIAYTIAVFSQKFKLDAKRLIILSVAGLWLCLIKDGYWLIALFPLIVPVEYFINKIHAQVWRISYAIILIFSSLIFAIRTSHVAATTVLTPRTNVYINSQAQLHYVLHNTPSFIFNILTQPFTKNYDTVYQGLVGIVGSRLIYLSIPIMGLLYFALYLTVFEIQPLAEIRKYKKRIWLSTISVILGTYLLISLAFYLGNTQVGAQYVFGVYGRYFLPILPLIIVFPIMGTIVLKLKRAVVIFASLIIVLISLMSTWVMIGA